MFKSVTGRRRYLLWIAIFGASFTCFALILALLLIPFICDLIVSKQVVITNGTAAWDRFVKLPISMTMNIYLFEVTNAANVVAGIEKPNLREVGPIVYTDSREKFDIKFEGDEHVSYYQKQIFQLDEEHSVIPKDMNISTVNFMTIGMYQIIENTRAPVPFALEDVLPKIMDDTHLFTTYAVDDFLFKGIKFCDPKKGDTLTKFICLVVMLINLNMVSVFDDLSMKYSVFGFKNDTHNGRFLINTGAKDLKKLGSVKSYNGMEYVHVWNGENSECNKVQGLDIATFPPYKEVGENFQVYSTDLCRAVTLNYQGSTQYRDLDVYEYAIGNDLLRPFVNESVENTCFCSHYTRGMDGEKSCFMDGIQDLYPCLGIPGLISQPHFLYADDKYRNSVSNVSEPVEDLHASKMLIHPFTGAPTIGTMGFQMSLIVRPIVLDGEFAPETKNVQNFTLPVLWMQQAVEIPDKYYDMVHEASIFLKVADIGKWVLVAIGAILFVIPTAILFIY